MQVFGHMHISVQHTTRDPCVGKEHCVNAINEAAHKLFQGKFFFCELFYFPTHLCLSFLSPVVSSFCEEEKKMPTVRSLWDARKERNFEISFIVNANEQNTIFIDFFLDPAVVDF